MIEVVEDVPAPEVLTTASGNFTTVPEPEPLTSGELDGPNNAEVEVDADDDGIAVITAAELGMAAADEAPEEAAATDEVEAAVVAAQAIFRGSQARKALAAASEEESATVAAVEVLPVTVEVVDEGGVAVGATKPVEGGSSTDREDEQATALYEETGAENVDAVASASCAPASPPPKTFLSPTVL